MSDAKVWLDELMENQMLSMGLPVLNEHVKSDEFQVSWEDLGKEEKDVVLSIQALARQLGADPGSYEKGTLAIVFKNKKAISDFMDAVELLSCADKIDDIDIEVRGEDLPNGRMDGYVPFDDVLFDGVYEYTAYVYLVPDIVQFSPYVEFDIDDEGDEEFAPENGVMFEVRRQIKVNFKGKRRIKMKCRPGFKWVADKKACVKITGSELATQRKAMRKMVRTKRSLGGAFKARVLRKQRRANKFRKAMGLK